MNESRRDMFRQLAQTEPVRMLGKWIWGKFETAIKAGEQFTSTPESAGLSLAKMPRRKGFNLPPAAAAGSLGNLACPDEPAAPQQAQPQSGTIPEEDEVSMEDST